MKGKTTSAMVFVFTVLCIILMYVVIQKNFKIPGRCIPDPISEKSTKKYVIPTAFMSLNTYNLSEDDTTIVLEWTCNFKDSSIIPRNIFFKLEIYGNWTGYHDRWIISYNKALVSKNGDTVKYRKEIYSSTGFDKGIYTCLIQAFDAFVTPEPLKNFEDVSSSFPVFFTMVVGDCYIPQCVGRQCGDGGCGYSNQCGTCDSGSCKNGICKPFMK